MFTFDFSRRVEFASICFVFGNANILDFEESIEVLGIRIPIFMKILYVTEVNLVFDLYKNSFFISTKTILVSYNFTKFTLSTQVNDISIRLTSALCNLQQEFTKTQRMYFRSYCLAFDLQKQGRCIIFSVSSAA